MKRIIIGLTISTLVIAYPVFASTYDSNYNARFKQRRWILSFSLAVNVDGPHEDMKKPMEDAGFGATVNDWLFGSTVYPRSNVGIGGTFGLKYLIKQPLAVGVITSYAYLGKTKGCCKSFPPVYLAVEYAVWTFAPIVSVQGKWFQLGVGPSLHYTNSYGENEVTRKRKLGFIVDFSLIVPTKSPKYFVELKGQYKGIGRVEIGPYTAAEAKYPMPATKVNFNNFTLGIGVGIRL